MLVPLSLLSTLALLVQSTDAARLPVNAPGSPRSSVQGGSELKAIYRQRQARSADIIRRIREGPKRKRQDPSAPVGPVCGLESGANVVANGNFETSRLFPWSATASSDELINLVGQPYGYSDSYGFALQNQDTTQAATVNLEQDVTVCAVTFDLAFDVGRFTPPGNDGSTCTLDLTIHGPTFSSSFYSAVPCAGGECTIPSPLTPVLLYSRYNIRNAITFTAAQAADTVTVSALFTCDAQGSDQNGKIYALDNIALTISQNDQVAT